MTVEQRKSGFDEFLTAGIYDHEIEAAKEKLTNAALESHLHHMGRVRDHDVDYTEGTVQVSLKNYFLNTVPESNEVNSLAIGLIPNIRHRPGYADSVDTTVTWQGVRTIENATNRAGTPLQAARIGVGAAWAIGESLGFKLAKGSLDWDTRDAADRLCKDLNEKYVGDLPEIAARVKEKGYQDFLDYLLDSKMLLRGRVDTLFGYGPQSNNTLF